MKRLFDIVVALTALLILSPVITLVALAILITMGRPVLFRQQRSGRDGQVFRVVKFRTMRAEAFADENDDARTPAVGRRLRESSLDELPQLWNILLGQMSLIGPRPTFPEDVAFYSECQRGRLAVRPGLTGWAQVNGRNSISWPERIELDLWYIENRTTVLDVKILTRTAVGLVRPKGVTAAGGVNPRFPGAGPVALKILPAPRSEAAVQLPNATTEAAG